MQSATLLGETKKYWETCVWIPGTAYSSKAVLEFNDDTLKTLLKECRHYRYKVFCPEQIDVMGLEGLKGLGILEIGCGAGHDAITMAKFGAKVTAVDIVPSNIALVDRYAKLWEVEVEAVTVPDLLEFTSDKKFDAIYAYGILHHVRNARVIVSRLTNCLKSDGKWLIMLYTPKVPAGEGDGFEGYYIQNYREDQVISRLFSEEWRIVSYEEFYRGLYAAIEVVRK